MDQKDPNPFGYTFTSEFLDGSPTAFQNGGPSLLSETENQSLNDFFSNTDPFLSEASAFPPPTDLKDSLADFNWDYLPPATIHRVSTTIPDQAQLHNNFQPPHSFAPDPLSAVSAHSHHQFTNTQDDLQAASTLFNNAHATHMNNGRSFSVPQLPTSNNGVTDPSAPGFGNIPMVPGPGGLLNEQLAALLPNHAENGSIDATVAAQFTRLQHGHVHIPELEPAKPPLKRSYTYGTDNNFHSAGYVPPSPIETEDAVTQRLLQNLRHPHLSIKDKSKRSGSSGRHDLLAGLVVASDEEQSEEESSDDDGDRPVKKRRRTKDGGKVSPRKSVSGSSGKNRKASMDGKKKRGSTAAQKRENLTEEQKRSNHIMSEQKRRNLIKRGFDDLHDLVPEIRNGGLSKSSVLMEAANFLEKVIEDNNHFVTLAGSPDD